LHRFLHSRLPHVRVWPESLLQRSVVSRNARGGDVSLSRIAPVRRDAESFALSRPRPLVGRSALRVLVAALSCLLPLFAHAQQDEDPKAQEEPDYLALADAPAFLPRSYLYWGSPVGSKEHPTDLIFALSYALHLPAYNNLREQVLRGKNWAGAATLSFEGDLRMLSVRSRPVRMPSYRPTMTGQLFYVLHGAIPWLFGGRLSFFHYSNGQDHCAYDEQLSDDSPDCTRVTAEVSDPRLQLNRRTGNFTMNGWNVQLDARVHRLSATRVAIAQLGFTLSVSGNLPLGSSSMDPATRHWYGWGKLGAEVDARQRFGWASLGLRASAAYFPRSGPRIPPAAGLVEINIGPYWLTGFGFFARYYGGRDFYNAFFVDRIHQFAAGLSWDGERPLKFASQPASDARAADASLQRAVEQAERAP
jgi:hypothetical protein